MIIGGVGAFLAFKLHYYVERRFKIDDAVGAVAVHGYSGFFGVVIAGFMLWGYPAAAPLAGSAAPWFRAAAEGFPMVNPIGNLIGAVIMFAVLGFAPFYVLARLLKAAGNLRVSRRVELAGLDTNTSDSSYPSPGTEIPLAIIGIALWVLFHILSTRAENREWDHADKAFDADLLLPGSDEPPHHVG